MTGASAHRDMVAIGASVGGVEALCALTAALRADLDAVVLVVLHIPGSGPSALPSILSRACPMSVSQATHGVPLRRGQVYTAPPDFHLLVADNRVVLSRGPTENGHRPAIDPLFRSVAQAFGPRAVGVVLSGSRDDGAAGLAAIAKRGGVTMVQDPAEALHPSMPLAALAATRVDHTEPAKRIGELLADITRRMVSLDDLPEDDPALTAEVLVARNQTIAEMVGTPAGFGCPSCGGALWDQGDWPVKHYRCRVGHAWSAQSLIEEQSAALEGALWTALRALDEKASLGRQVADSSAACGDETGKRRFSTVAEDAAGAADTLRALIDRLGSTATEPQA